MHSESGTVHRKIFTVGIKNVLDGFVFLNLRGRGTAVFDVSDPCSPVFAGEHDLAEWTDGVRFEPGRAYRLHRGGVEAAAWR